MDRIPKILHALKQPTFVTIDIGFWNRNLLNPNYCIIYFAIQDQQQSQISKMLRRLFHIKKFKTKATRMGKIVKVSTRWIEYWQWNNPKRISMLWDFET